MIPRLLLVEDEPSLVRGLADSFRDEGYDVRFVERGDEAASAIREFHPDVLVLDILLPGRSGLDVLRELRASDTSLPVLMLTAKSDVVDRVVGLELGADDYLTKPFAERELLARVRALLRRRNRMTGELDGPDSLILEGIRFDFRSLTATGPDGPLELTTHDILVLKVLAQRRGEVVARIDVVEEVCGLDSDAVLRTVDNHIVALRGCKVYKDVQDETPKTASWSHQLSRAKMFANLIGNTDRNKMNILVDPNGDLVLIDHTRSFSSDEELLGPPVQFDRRLVEKLRHLNPAGLSLRLKGILDMEAIEHLLERRDALLAHMEQLIEERGEASVLF